MHTVPQGHVAAVLYARNILFHTRRYDFECTRLIILDCCSALAGADAFEVEGYWGDVDTRPFVFSDSTWADYVSFHHPEEFLWAHPRPECPRDRDCRSDGFIRDPDEVPFEEIPAPDGIYRPWWEKLIQYHAQPPGYGIDLASIRAASIVLPWRGTASAAVVKLLRSHNLTVLDCLSERLETTVLRSVEMDASASTPTTGFPTGSPQNMGTL
jgi:hypothetical protein